MLKFIHSLTHLAVIIDKSSHSKTENCIFFDPLVQFNTMPNDFSELVSVEDLFLFLIISLFNHVYLLRYIRLFSFLLSYGKNTGNKKHATCQVAAKRVE